MKLVESIILAMGLVSTGQLIHKLSPGQQNLD